MNIKVSVLFARLLLGLILFWQGFGKIFSWSLTNVYENGFKSFEATILPEFVLKFTLYLTSYGEFICGILLILGLFRKQSYYVIALILLIVAFGHGLQSPIWDLQHVFIRSVFLIFLMMMPLKKDTFSLDNYINKRNK